VGEVEAADGAQAVVVRGSAERRIVIGTRLYCRTPVRAISRCGCGSPSANPGATHPTGATTMDIGSLLNQAGGISAIAQQLGVDEATVERGAGALLPHVKDGVETQGLPAVEAAAADPQALAAEPGQGGFLGGLLGAAMGEGGMMSSGAGGGILGSLIGGGGNEILGQIFGSKDKSREVASQASEQSGVDPSILKKLLPIVAGAVAMHYMKKRGHGGAAAGDEGGGLLGSILGGLGGR
jgi:hypothetical protein